MIFLYTLDMKLGKKEVQKTFWVLIYTKANEERKASVNLQNQGFNTFLPLITPTNKKNSELESLVPVFPRYMFAQINSELDNWSSIQSTYGVSNIVMFSEKLTPISNDIIELIQDRLNETGAYKENISVVDYQKGDQISIKDGRFAGIDAIFLSKKSKDRVRLLLKLLNTSIVAEISKSYVGHKEVVKNFKL